MRILGAVVAGGKSRRFGSDKALFPYHGVALIDYVINAIAQQTDAIVVCGREWPGVASLPDRPDKEIGPLAGLNAALHYGVEHGYDAVLSVPVDTYPLPPNLTDILGHAPAALRKQYLIGIWPSGFGKMLDEHLARGGRSVMSWIEACGCRLVEDQALRLHNLNALSGTDEGA